MRLQPPDSESTLPVTLPEAHVVGLQRDLQEYSRLTSSYVIRERARTRLSRGKFWTLPLDVSLIP